MKFISMPFRRKRFALFPSEKHAKGQKKILSYISQDLSGCE